MGGKLPWGVADLYTTPRTVGRRPFTTGRRVVLIPPQESRIAQPTH